MPLYEYQCDACGARFERIQKFSDPPVESCPACSGAVRKLISSPAIQFKGSGWYITDYARKSSGEGADKGKGADKDAKGESKRDSGTSDGKSSSSDGGSKTADSSKPAASPATKD